MGFERFGIKLSLPFNFAADWESEVLAPYAAFCEEAYLPVHGVHTARPATHGLTEPEYLRRVDSLHEAAAEKGVRLCFVANQVPGPGEAAALLGQVGRLHGRYPDATYTIRSLDLAARLRHAHPALRVGPSTLSMVDGVIPALYWRRSVAPVTITVAREINRRPAILAALKRLGFRVKLVAQGNCIPWCPVQPEHMRRIADADDLGASGVKVPVRGLGSGRPSRRRQRTSRGWRPRPARSRAAAAIGPGTRGSRRSGR